MIEVLQFSALIFSLAMVYFALIHYRKGTISKLEMWVWLIIWLFAIFSVVFTDILRSFAKTFSFSRLFDMMVVGGFFLVISLSVRSYLITRKLEKKFEDFVRKKALKDAKKVKK